MLNHFTPYWNVLTLMLDKSDKNNGCSSNCSLRFSKICGFYIPCCKTSSHQMVCGRYTPTLAFIVPDSKQWIHYCPFGCKSLVHVMRYSLTVYILINHRSQIKVLQDW